MAPNQKVSEIDTKGEGKGKTELELWERPWKNSDTYLALVQVGFLYRMVSSHFFACSYNFKNHHSGITASIKISWVLLAPTLLSPLWNPIAFIPDSYNSVLYYILYMGFWIHHFNSNLVKCIWDTGDAAAIQEIFFEWFLEFCTIWGDIVKL
jgi:hypothetical protein